jgi:aminoglycoside 6'-N-acetyltransferase
VTDLAIPGDGLVLRQAGSGDLAEILRVLQDPTVERWWGRYDMTRVVKDYEDDDEAVVFLVEVDGVVAGIIQYSEEEDPQYRHAGIDIAIVGAYQRQGVGPRAIKALAAHLIDERGHHRLTIDPAADNRNAIRAYEAVGFRPVGIMRQYERGLDGTWRNGLLMDMLAGELRR